MTRNQRLIECEVPAPPSSARRPGWTFSPGRIGDGWQPADVVPMSGVAGGVEITWIVSMWKVDDVEAAAARVVEAGGTIIEEPARQPYGMSALCTDDRGGRFHLGDA
jgi:hypothetical protein